MSERITPEAISNMNAALVAGMNSFAHRLSGHAARREAALAWLEAQRSGDPS